MGEKDHDREREYSPNPDFNGPKRVSLEAQKVASFEHHKNAGSLGTYYDLYPEDRPVERER